MATAEDQQTLARIRTRHDEASIDWSLLVAGKRHEQIAARLLPKAEPVTILTLTEDCGYQDREFLLHAHRDMWFLLQLLAEAFREIRRLKDASRPKQADFAAESAMKCDDPLFKTYLAERHGADISDRERVAARLRSVLAIKSRSELNTDPSAAERWKSLRADFDAWRRVG